jgi:hypothetical protein
MKWRYLFATLVAFVGASAVSACSCNLDFPTRPCEGFKKLDAVFVGHVTKIEGLPENASPQDVREFKYRFAVDEAISGIKVAGVEVYSSLGNGDCGFRFDLGESYIVFSWRSEGGNLVTSICTKTRELKNAPALLPQMRAMRDGRKPASLFGILTQSQHYDDSVRVDGFDRTLAGIKMELKSDHKAYETTTNDSGAYTFYGVKKGSYVISAKLPPNLEIEYPSEKLPDSACLEDDLRAMPTSGIKGRVVIPDGFVIPFAKVQLFRVEKYGNAKYILETQQRQGDDNFEFEHIVPGKYILVFNYQNKIVPDLPFPRTFYPGVSTLESAVPVEVKEGQQVLDADIRLSGGRATRELLVHYTWDKKDPPIEIQLSTHGSDGSDEGGWQVIRGLHRFLLFRDVQYRISAVMDCGLPLTGPDAKKENPRRKLLTQFFDIDGANENTQQITFLFDRCGH